MFNVERFIVTCLNSVYAQGLKEEEFEVILIDDESPDEVVAIANEYLKGKSNFKIISQKNKGLGGARNTGIQSANGDFILFLDADDIILPNSLPSVLNLAKEYSLDILEFGAEGIDVEGHEVYKIRNTTNLTVLDGITYYNSVRYMHSACNKLYSRNFLISNSLSFTENIFIEDFEFNTRTFSVAERVMASDFLVSAFLQTDNSITRNSSPDKKNKMINDIICVLRKTVEIQKSISMISAAHIVFFEERKAFLVATLFYQLFKNRASYVDIKTLKKRLEAQDLFFIDYPIYDLPKNRFRILFLKNVWMYKLIQPLVPLLNYIIKK